MNVESVVLGTLIHSPQVRVLTDAPMIRQTAVVEEQAKFDLHNFAESRFTDTSDPVGSTLTTGGAPRFIDQNLFASGGVRKLTASGAQIEVSQRMGYETNNSLFFVPNQQGTAKMALALTQPLLNGAGKAYNRSLIVIAEINSGIARDQLSKDLQAMLLEVHRTYWDLYLQRASLLQKRKLHQEAVSILDELNARRDVDVLGSQLVRARAAVATREAATIRYETSVANVESKLRAQVNDPALQTGGSLEMIPSQRPNQGYCELQLYDSLVMALENRPEVSQATKELKAASVKADVSKNELLPVVNFILGTYVSGLHGGGAFMPAYSNQFNLGRPSYSTGLTFDMPIGNRAAKSRLQQRRLEIRQMTNQLQNTVANVRADVEIAVREVATTHREMQSRYHAMMADEAEIQYLTERWRLLPGDQQVAGVVLDNLLNAQERLADAEYGFANALVAYNVALVKLKWATGTLLNYQDLQQTVVNQDGLPTLTFGQPGSEPTPPVAGPMPVAGPTPAATPMPPGAPTVQPAPVQPPPVYYDEAQMYRLPPVQ